MLFSFNSKSKWTSSAEDIFLQVLAINGYIVVIIMITGLGIMIYQKCKAKKSKSDTDVKSIAPKTHSLQHLKLNSQNIYVDSKIEEEKD
mmetsp:Transcript_18632/g.16499  ORF Transcript_18632/g.16499 Transcript_18632/m.16499 type:complete len:89 (-) Transcript_18632:90-356(-)